MVFHRSRAEFHPGALVSTNPFQPIENGETKFAGASGGCGMMTLMIVHLMCLAVFLELSSRAPVLNLDAVER